MKTLTDVQTTKDQVYLKLLSSGFLIKYTKKKDDGNGAAVSLHAEEIKKNLDDVNMDPWYYIYENYVNPTTKKKV